MAVTNISEVYDETLARLKEQYDENTYERPGNTPFEFPDVYQGTTHTGRRIAAKVRKEMEDKMGNMTFGDVEDKGIETPTVSSKSCVVCMKKVTSMKRCSRCKNVRYCSVECQKEDWVKQHKEVCSSIKLLE